MFAGMSRDLGCSLIHPDPNEADINVLKSSAVSGNIIMSFVYNFGLKF